MQACPFCTVVQIDSITTRTDLHLAGTERQRLIAALLARRHIILSGPAGIGKRRLARALALAVADNHLRQVITIQGHPWWAAKTGDVARFVEMQTQFSILRFGYFLEDILRDKTPPPSTRKREGSRHFAVCIMRMSPLEIEFYFRQILRWLRIRRHNEESTIPLHLIGTYDGESPPLLDDSIRRIAAVVHFTSSFIEEKEGLE